MSMMDWSGIHILLHTNHTNPDVPEVEKRVALKPRMITLDDHTGHFCWNSNLSVSSSWHPGSVGLVSISLDSVEPCCINIHLTTLQMWIESKHKHIDFIIYYLFII